MITVYKIIFCLLILLFFAPSVFSQSWDELNTSMYDYYLQRNYEKAIEYGEKAVKQAEIEFGKNHENYATSLNVVAFLNNKVGNYKKSESLYNELLRIQKQIYGENHPNYTTSLNWLANTYECMNNYEKAELFYIEALNIRKRILGENHKDYAQSLNNLANLYYITGNYTKAEPLHLQACQIYKSVLGENNINYAISLHNLGELYRATGNYKNAEIYYLNSLDILKKDSAENQDMYASCLHHLGLLYSVTGNYKKAEPLLLESLNKKRQLLGDRHPSYAKSLFNLAELYQIMGEYIKAESMFWEALNIIRTTLGENNPDYILSLNGLALFYTYKGEYTKAEELYKNGLKLAEQVLGKNHPDYATYLNSLGGLYQSMGQYTKAEILFYEALNIRKTVFGENHISYATSLNNLATLYNYFGNFSKAESLYIEASKIYKNILGESHLSYIALMNNLAVLYLKMGNYINAETLLLETLNKARKILTDNHPNYALTLNNLALLYSNLGNYTKAEQLYLEASNIYKEILGEKHPDFAMLLNNLGTIYLSLGEYSKSEEFLKEALKIRKGVLGENHPDYAQSLNNLALLYWTISDYNKSETLLLESNKNYVNQINSYFPILSETEKEKFIKTIETKFNIFYSFSLNYYKDKPSISSEMINIHLSTKGVIHSSMNRIKESVSKSGNKELIALSDKLTMTKKSLYNASLLSIEEQTKRGINFTEFENEANNLEKELSRKSDLYRELLEEKDITYEQIQNSLANDEAVVEFIDFSYWDKRWTDTTYYIALITRPGYKTPVLVKLCTEDELGNKLNFTPDEIIRGFDPEDKPGSVSLSEKYKDIYNLIWKPLEEHLQGCNTVYISPSGALNKISFAALSPDGSSYLMDKINIRYTGNPRDIVSEKKREGQVTINSAVLFGGAYYDTDAEILKSYQRTGEVSEIREVINPFAYTNEKDKLIGEENPSDRGNVWNYLPGTLQEVKDIGGLLSDKGITVTLDTGNYANEKNLKLLSGSNDVQILHISTHGFFFTDAEKDYSKTMMGITDSKQTTRILDNPLYRSGIVLSGAGKNTEKKEINPEININDINTEDGIITAYEISLLDLSNTELAVLSACETGLGDIKGGEGVYGLQRSFKTAGAKNVIISLWKVPDKETGELMKLFYENWLNKNMDKRDALIEAQKQMKKLNPNPYYWAAFVMM